MKILKRIVTVTVGLLLMLAFMVIPVAAQGPDNHYPRYPSHPNRFPLQPRYYYPQFQYRPAPRFLPRPFSVYIVKPNDTLFRIAIRFGVSVRAILVANPQIRNANRIFVGERLIIPGRYAAPVQGGGPYGGGSTYGGNGVYGGSTYQGGGAYGGGQAYGGSGAAGQPQQSTPQMTQPQGQAQVIMQNMSFQPHQITVKVGTTVTWINRDSFAHTVTAGTRDNPNGLFDSGNIESGGVFSHTFQEPGTYNYFCRIHNGMNGVVIVEN